MRECKRDKYQVLRVLYFQHSYIYIKELLITSPKRKPLIKNSNISNTKDYITYDYYKL